MTDADSTSVLVQQSTDQHGIAWITLDSPATRNALSDELLDQLLAALEASASDPNVRVVVLGSSHERIFSAGGDLKMFAEDTRTVDKFARLDRFPRLYDTIGSLGKPVILAAGGDVLAGAFGLALACDLVIARRGVRFGCPEINVGVFPFMISALIYRNVPRKRANALMMTGESIDADEAARLDFVNAVVDPEEFQGAVEEWARKVASKSPLLMKMGKDALFATRDAGMVEALELLRGQLSLALTTDDVREGVQAFREQRPPVWQQH